MQVAQKNQFFKSIRINWDKSACFICPINELEMQLKKARINEIGTKHVSLCNHAFAIEKVEEGFYVFEPNAIKELMLLKDEKEVVQEIIIPLFLKNNY